MNDLISREQAIEKVKAVTKECIPNLPNGPCKRCFIWGTNTAVQTILHDVPSAEKTGKWMHERLLSTVGGTYPVTRCSVCQNTMPFEWETPYCPNCGARMVEE